MKASWDRRYREGFYSGALNPHSLLIDFSHLILQDPVLDLASGLGRDSGYLMRCGLKVVCFDISLEALRRSKENFLNSSLKNFLLVCGDAESLPFKDETFSGIIVFYFYSKRAVDGLKKALKRRGIVIYETFLKRQNLIDRWRNPKYLLDDGELLRLFEDFDCLFYEEGLIRIDGKLKALSRFVGRKL